VSAAASATPPDLLIVGGGPAGLAAAIGARLAGLTAVVLDRARPPIDKACGEGLMPDGVAALRRLGVEPPHLGGHPFRGIRYVDDSAGAEAAGEFPGGATGLGLRRTRLHAALVRRAEEVGVELRWGTAVEGLVDEGSRFAAATAAGPVAGRVLVAADGLRSRLRREAGLAAAPARRRRFGVRRHFRLAPWSDEVEVWWADGREAYVTPAGDGEVGVAILWSPDRDPNRGGFDDQLAAFPRLAARLAGAAAASKDRGAGPFHQRVRAVHRGNLLLLGDAAGYLDALTGEGLALAFHQAAALVEAVASGDLDRYTRAHRRLHRLPDAMTALLLAVERRPRLRRRMVRALAAEPALFSRLLGVHARSLPLSDFGMRGAVRLAWELARA
jgi:flavin-dependent dehydrogenase